MIGYVRRRVQLQLDRIDKETDVQRALHIMYAFGLLSGMFIVSVFFATLYILAH